uniref:FH2 domain-containing protein n=1 Tax=Piliocolobus tephrosceles TaxID=591936 RepID=A0A8C9GM09_9PRIM
MILNEKKNSTETILSFKSERSNTSRPSTCILDETFSVVDLKENDESVLTDEVTTRVNVEDEREVKHVKAIEDVAEVLQVEHVDLNRVVSSNGVINPNEVSVETISTKTVILKEVEANLEDPKTKEKMKNEIKQIGSEKKLQPLASLMHKSKMKKAAPPFPSCLKYAIMSNLTVRSAFEKNILNKSSITQIELTMNKTDDTKRDDTKRDDTKRDDTKTDDTKTDDTKTDDIKVDDTKTDDTKRDDTKTDDTKTDDTKTDNIKVDSTHVVNIKMKDGINKVVKGDAKKYAKKAPGLPPSFLLNKMKMGVKPKFGLNKCPMNMKINMMKSAEEKRPLGIKLHWQLLPTHKIEGTVFNEIKAQEIKYNLIDTKTVHKLFARVKNEKKLLKKGVESSTSGISNNNSSNMKNGSMINSNKSNEVKLITVLERGRAQNIGILLRFPMSTQEIVKKINNFEIENMTIEFLQKLLHILPTKEESDCILNKLKDEKVKEEHFRDVERKLIPFVHLNNCQNKIEICLFALKYDKMINEINKYIDTYDTAVKEVRSSIRLRSLLKAVLKWGNYVNYGINDNEDLVALGFTLSSVLKLAEFKSSLDSSITSLHYIIANLCMYLPNLNMNLLEKDLSTVLLASKMSSEAVDILLGSLEKDINYIKTQLNSNYEQNFCDKMKCILQDSEEKYVTYQKKYEQTKQNVFTLGTYLGEDMTKINNIENIFIILSSIVNLFTKCYKDILANSKKFSIMFHDENVLNEYYKVFSKTKNKWSSTHSVSTNNSSNSASATNKSINKNTLSNGTNNSNEKNVINKNTQENKLNIKKLKTNTNSLQKHTIHNKSSMFQLRNQLMEDIKNKTFLKKSARIIKTEDITEGISSNSKNDTHSDDNIKCTYSAINSIDGGMVVGQEQQSKELEQDQPIQKDDASVILDELSQNDCVNKMNGLTNTGDANEGRDI